MDLEEGLGLEWSRRWRREEVLVAVVEEEVVVVAMVGFRDSSSSSIQLHNTLLVIPSMYIEQTT